MANTHAIPDTMSEIQSICEDLLPACVLSTTFPTVPGSGMVLSAFATHGYVLDGQNLIYVEQPAISVTLTGSAGNFWLALHRDVSTAVAGWTRRPGSHYLWQTNATQPANPAGALVFCQVVVTATNITAVTPLAGARNPMSKQMSSAVAITGGSIQVPTGGLGAGAPPVGGFELVTGTGPVYIGGSMGFAVNPPTVPLDVNGQVYLRTQAGIGAPPSVNTGLILAFNKTTQQGIYLRTTANDAGTSPHITFANAAGGGVGTIICTATATAYNTSSDVRLKHAVAALTGALDAIAALRPVRFRWNADDSQDEGFLAHELQQVLPHAVSGEADAVHEDGSVKPQQVDHSKLVVWLVGAVQELAARVQSLEEQLGI